MIFTESAPTPFDVRFRLLGVPVRIHPMFWIVALILGGSETPQRVAIWVAAVLISVLVHEFGHALLQRTYGGSPSIVLYGFGGLAMAPGTIRSAWRNITVALAGPFAGLALAGLLALGLERVGTPQSPVAFDLVEDLLLINYFWSVINLAPIWPLDGGQVAREVLVAVLPPSRGVVASLVLSIVAAVAVGVWLYIRTQSLWNVMLFGLLAYQNYEALRAYAASRW